MTEHVSTQTSIGQSVVNLTRYQVILNGVGEGLFVNDYNIFSLFSILSPFIFTFFKATVVVCLNVLSGHKDYSLPKKRKTSQPLE